MDWKSILTEFVPHHVNDSITCGLENEWEIQVIEGQKGNSESSEYYFSDEMEQMKLLSIIILIKMKILWSYNRL